MEATEIIAAYQAEKKGEKPKRRKKPLARLPRKELKDHYPAVKEAVKEGVPLGSVLRILSNKEEAFRDEAGEPMETKDFRNLVYAPYRRQLIDDGVLSDGKGEASGRGND